MSCQNISSSKLFIASLEAQFDAFVNRDAADENSGNPFETIQNQPDKNSDNSFETIQNQPDDNSDNSFKFMQNKLENELNTLMGKIDHKPNLSVHHPRSQRMTRDLADSVPTKINSPSGNHFTSKVTAPAHLSNKRASHFNALNAAFTVSVFMVLALPWLLWPTQYLTPPDVDPELHLADIIEPSASTVIEDTTQQVVSVISADTPRQVATAEVANTILDNNAPDKPKSLNSMLSINPTGTGNVKKPANQKSAVDNILEITPPIGRIRSEPSLQGKVVARLQHGTLVIGLGHQGNWLRVRLPDNREAWAYKNIVVPSLPTKH